MDQNITKTAIQKPGHIAKWQCTPVFYLPRDTLYLPAFAFKDASLYCASET
jgi:hypothetical protein